MSAVDVLGMSPAFVMGQGAAKKVLGQAEKYCKQWQLGMAGRGRGGQWPPKLLGATTPHVSQAAQPRQRSSWTRRFAGRAVLKPETAGPTSAEQSDLEIACTSRKMCGYECMRT